MKAVKRRRHGHRTDYGKRLKMLKGADLRIIFRKTNRYLLAQVIKSKEAQDKVIFGTSSKELVNYGWPKEITGSLKSISAAYLLGVLIAKKLKEKKLETNIVDFGMMRMVKKTKPFAFLKGLLDFGVGIKCDEKNFPLPEKIAGKNIKNFNFEEIKSKITGK